jgi:hypothetical protein
MSVSTPLDACWPTEKYRQFELACGKEASSESNWDGGLCGHGRPPDQVGDHPVVFPLLHGGEVECQQFAAAESAAEEHGEHRVVAQLARRRRGASREQPTSLLRCQPVAQPHAETANALDAADAGRQLGEAGVSGLVRHAPDGRESKVDGRWRVVLRFEVDPIAEPTVRLNASRGSEQYYATNSRIAWS